MLKSAKILRLSNYFIISCFKRSRQLTQFHLKIFQETIDRKPLTGSYLEAMNDVIVAAEQKDDQGSCNGGKV